MLIPVLESKLFWSVHVSFSSCYIPKNAGLTFGSKQDLYQRQNGDSAFDKSPARIETSGPQFFGSFLLLVDFLSFPAFLQMTVIIGLASAPLAPY